MIVLPMNPNAIYVSMARTGCLKYEFDPTYPAQLNGIISREEYQQSIENINRTISSRKSSVICGIISLIFLIAGIVLFIVGGAITVNSSKKNYSGLLDIGIVVVIIGLIILCAGCCIIRVRRSGQLRQVIATESMKYSMRSPTPCSWRLDSTRMWGGQYTHHRGSSIHLLVIDVGNPIGPGYGNVSYYNNGAAFQPPPYYARQNNISAPPPYNTQPVAGSCNQCGALRQNSTARFCASCGQPFKM